MRVLLHHVSLRVPDDFPNPHTADCESNDRAIDVAKHVPDRGSDAKSKHGTDHGANNSTVGCTHGDAIAGSDAET